MTYTPTFWNRRTWLAHQLPAVLTLSKVPGGISHLIRCGRNNRVTPAAAARVAAQSQQVDPAVWQTLAQQAVDAARTAGAQYAEARLTRKVGHKYNFGDGIAELSYDTELNGIGVRVLVDGYWGFTACPWLTADAAGRLAQDAVAQAHVNAQGSRRTVDLGVIPVAQGSWTTPIRIDPFHIPIEEKLDLLQVWMNLAWRAGLRIPLGAGHLRFIRQERFVATSEGGRFLQVLYESGGEAGVQFANSWQSGDSTQLPVNGLDVAGKGWELVLDAKVAEQLAQLRPQLITKKFQSGQRKPATIGRYTLVCDGPTMAELLRRTLGTATQLDRALGYEANASGTSFLDDPLGMVGNYQVTSPLVTVTANRSVPTQLATVQWDDEGVEPHPFTLIKNGVLVDFQTTREQATWLAPYYQRQGLPMGSRGCSAAEDALVTPLQMMPNLALESESTTQLDDLVKDIKDGIMITAGRVREVDFQGRTGLLVGTMQEIKQGRLGRGLSGGGVLFNTENLWKNILALGGLTTEGGVQAPRGEVQIFGNDEFIEGVQGGAQEAKGQPAQTTAYSARAVAAVIASQPLINPGKRA